MAAAGADQSAARRDAPSPVRGDAPPAQADVVDMALGLVLGNAAARAALLTYDDDGWVESYAGRDAVRLASKGLRAAYDEHVARAWFQGGVEGFGAGRVSPRQFRWPRLREVRVFNCTLALTVELRAAAEGWPQLRVAVLFDTAMPIVEEFLLAPPPELVELTLGACPVSPADYYCIRACELLRRARLPRLEVLGIFDWYLDAACAVHLVAADWPRLKALKLHSQPFAAGVLEALGAAPWAAGLEALELRNCRLNPPDAGGLWQGRWTQLRRLVLRVNVLDDAGLAALLAAPWVGDLEELDLSGIGLTEAGGLLLLGVEWRRLRRLDLCGHGRLLGQSFRAVAAELEARHPGLKVQLD